MQILENRGTSLTITGNLYKHQKIDDDQRRLCKSMKIISRSNENQTQSKGQMTISENVKISREALKTKTNNQDIKKHFQHEGTSMKINASPAQPRSAQGWTNGP